MTATFVRQVRGNGYAALYKLDGETQYDWDDERDIAPTTQYVVVSAIPAFGALGGEETFIFPADQDGNILSFLELPGSFQGGQDHARALRGLGYEIEAG